MTHLIDPQLLDYTERETASQWLSDRTMRTTIPAKSFASASMRIGIVGGGLSGVMVAVHLLKQATNPLEIFLIDQNSIGEGVAYGTRQDCHLLNVPAGKMSFFADQPNHFLHWLQHNFSSDADIAAFVPRRIYGEYIQSVLQDAVRYSSIAHLRCHRDIVTAIHPQQSQLELVLQTGISLVVDRVVLAFGNPPPRNPAISDSRFYESDRYVRSAWNEDWLSRLSSSASVLLIGSGLTAIDQVMTLKQRGHCGAIHLVSRRGLIPQSHQLVPAYNVSLPEGRTVRSLWRWVRQEVDRARLQGYDWRSVMDALRPQTESLWQRLSLEEQRRFLRHLRPYWEVHRHRVAPTIAQELNQLLHTRQLQIHAGRIQAFHETRSEVTTVIRKRGSQDLIEVRSHLVLNCTGSECDYRQVNSPLIEQLLATGLVCSDPLHLGLAVAENGALIDDEGRISQQIFTIGSPRKGNFWETTAVPEIRIQGQRVAQTLLKSFTNNKSKFSGNEAVSSDEAIDYRKKVIACDH
ncbi:FAD/NAD(P)-binding protein [Leptolyngbya sp. FACHB-711]|uniref:FAD/NAD(P)-binding protein n=1 Tax=unclassified Leptolyngbya TaxID=2650499 RepID=UPI0016835E2A|nr:FAD/NAD(P)-binding protein [Leptolyngbya sp. FACHB-711]MBD1853724.1 FAD/NAD(P)-binding protein [Cyanobacteria bacterium FACHB-502]MBD2026490.1 FAD/NAD(P)-binding protein [Leptolyngbya sp. FACHB-711]